MAQQTFTCKLTTPELRERKRTTIASLKKLVLERKEIENGFRYRFHGNDGTLDLLVGFIKTERLCCDFFDFDLKVSGTSAWLMITGPEGVKEFMEKEIEI